MTTHIASSTVRRPERHIASSTLAEIDGHRQRAQVSLARLLAEAGINESAWYRARRDKAALRHSTVQRLEAALERLVAGVQRQVKNPVLAVYRMTVAQLAIAGDLDVAEAQAAALDFDKQKPSDPQWLALAQLRQLAIYIVTVEMEVSNSALALAIGCTRQNVFKARNAVEDRREADPKVAAAIAAVAGAWSGV
jgi:hypothetical protein